MRESMSAKKTLDFHIETVGPPFAGATLRLLYQKRMSFTAGI
jgi:hypothetical protein